VVKKNQPLAKGEVNHSKSKHDITPVFPLTSSGFMLVLAQMPLSTQQVILHALAVQRKCKTKL